MPTLSTPYSEVTVFDQGTWDGRVFELSGIYNCTTAHRGLVWGFPGCWEVVMGQLRLRRDLTCCWNHGGLRITTKPWTTQVFAF